MIGCEVILWRRRASRAGLSIERCMKCGRAYYKSHQALYRPIVSPAPMCGEPEVIDLCMACQYREAEEVPTRGSRWNPGSR
jgi:hypothetical protein